MKKIRLKDDLLYKAKNNATRYQIAQDLPLSQTTVYKLLGPNAADMTRIDLDVLAAILFDGMGITPADFLNMRIGELFEVKEQVPTP